LNSSDLPFLPEKYHRGWGYVKYLEVNTVQAAGCKTRGQDAAGHDTAGGTTLEAEVQLGAR
jgi:hypothetical protein